MLEIVLLTVIVVGLYRKRGERWEWNRVRVGRAFGDLSDEGERVLQRAHRAGPGMLSQCIADVQSLGGDLVSVLHPSAQRRIQQGTRKLIARRQRLAAPPTDFGAVAAGSGVVGADPEYARLQQRYLEGGISLDQYVEEANRLHVEETPS